jgi:hypothetical protein
MFLIEFLRLGLFIVYQEAYQKLSFIGLPPEKSNASFGVLFFYKSYLVLGFFCDIMLTKGMDLFKYKSLFLCVWAFV